MFDWLKKQRVGQLNECLKNIVNKLELLLRRKIQMVDMYVALIINKRRTIDQVPAQYKDAVLADLTALGVDGYGNPLPTETTAE
jgi:hypothetical protein